MNSLKALMMALSKQQTPEMIAAKRGKSIVDINEYFLKPKSHRY